MDTVFYGSVSSSDNDDGEESVGPDQRQTMCECVNLVLKHGL